MNASRLETIGLRDLRWAIIASQHRSLRQAAEALNIKQSTLSRRLREIESQLDAEIFVRSNGGTHLTTAGANFIATSRWILEEAESAFVRLRARSHGESGSLRLGVHASLSTGNLKAILVEYRDRFSDVVLHTVDGSRDRLLCALMNDAVDVAVISGRAPEWGGPILGLWPERAVVALPDGHRLLERTFVEWRDLGGETFLLPRQGPGPELGELLSMKLQHMGAQLTLYQDSSLDRLLSLVSLRCGVLLMLEGATGIRCQGVHYREVRDDDGPTQVHFASCWREANSNPALRPFIALLRERYPDFAANSAILGTELPINPS